MTALCASNFRWGRAAARYFRCMEVRMARSDDAEAIRAIFSLEVLDSTNVFELVAPTLVEQRRWLDDHTGTHPCVVAVDERGSVVGYASLSPYRARPGYRTTVEDSVYVHRDHQQQGVGRALLQELITLANAHGFHAVIGRVVGHNEASIGLHLQLGFGEVGVEREVGRKFGQWLDVVVLQRLLS